MIQLNSDQRLTIVLPNTNKALAEAIKNASPEQLNTLKEGKDLRSFLTSVFNDKISASKSDQTLMEILKNAPAFKNMGSFTETLNTLASEIKQSPELALKSSPLEPLLKNISLMDGESLKKQLSESGVFMESKIAQVLQNFPNIKETLEKLQSLLTQSSRPETKTVAAIVTALLNDPKLEEKATTDPKSAKNIVDGLRQIIEQLQNLRGKSDVLYTPKNFATVEKLSRLLETFVSQSSIKESHINPASPATEQTLQEIKTILKDLYSLLLSSKARDSNTLLDALERLMVTLKSPQNETAIQQELKGFISQFEKVLEHADPALSKDAGTLLNRLNSISTPESILLEPLLEESLKEDIKSRLLGLSHELESSSHPKAPELLEHVDKLLTQIDYHQLLSYLGSSNSIYFPFSWDLLEEGSMGFKKGKEKKFYCEINLKLKEYGELNLLMALYEGNQLEIQAHTEKKELKELIDENVEQLRSFLIDAGLSPRRIRVFGMKETKTSSIIPYGSDESMSNGGFEVTV